MAKLSSKEWRVGRTCVFQNHIHLVFVTKYRRDVLTNAMLVRLKELFSEICQGLSSQLLEFNGEDDHVHLVVSLHPKISLSILIGRLKGKSAYFLRREFWPEIKTRLWGEHFWSPSYMAISSGGEPLAIIKQYIEQQRCPS
jgi:putative transposase